MQTERNQGKLIVFVSSHAVHVHWNQEVYYRQRLAASHRAVQLSESTRKAIKRRNDFYRRLLSEYPGLAHLKGFPLLDIPIPEELPSELASRIGLIQRHFMGHYGPEQYSIWCATFGGVHDTCNDTLDEDGPVMSYNGIADRYGDLLPAEIPTKLIIKGELIRTDYKSCFLNNISEHHQREWESYDTAVVQEHICDAINASQVEIRTLAYGSLPKQIWGPRYLAAFEMEMTTRGGSVEIIHESATYDEYLGTWNENDVDLTFLIRIYESPHFRVSSFVMVLLLSKCK